MSEEFSRTQLLLGRRAMERLGRASVAVFGLGGVGGHAAEALARSGIGAMTLVDDDVVCLSNLNRQLVATHRTIGRKKVEVMAERVADINPRCAVDARVAFYSAETAGGFDLQAFDYIVDAIDTVSSKLTLIENARRAGVPIISSMGAGNKLDPTRLELADIYETSVCPLARVMRRELRARGVPALRVVYSREDVIKPDKDASADGGGCTPGAARPGAARRQTPGSVSFVPPAAGLILASAVVRDLIGDVP